MAYNRAEPALANYTVEGFTAVNNISALFKFKQKQQIKKEIMLKKMLK